MMHFQTTNLSSKSTNAEGEQKILYYIVHENDNSDLPFIITEYASLLQPNIMSL